MLPKSIQCLTLALMLSVPFTLASSDCALARGYKAHVAPKHEEQEAEQPQEESSQQMQEPNQEEQQSQGEEAQSNQESAPQQDSSTMSTLGSSSPTSALRQMIDDRFRPPSTPGGVSLFKVVGDLVMLMVLISVMGCIPIASSVLLCAIIYHVGNMFRGGKKPQIG